MAYAYQTIFKSGGYDFDLYKNRFNSKESGVIAVNRKDHNDVLSVAIINNKTNEFKLLTDRFDEKVIGKLKEKIKV